MCFYHLIAMAVLMGAFAFQMVLQSPQVVEILLLVGGICLVLVTLKVLHLQGHQRGCESMALLAFYLVMEILFFAANLVLLLRIHYGVHGAWVFTAYQLASQSIAELAQY